MLQVLIRSASLRNFLRVPQHMFSWRNKKYFFFLNISYLSLKIYVGKALLLSTHNICFHGEIKKKYQNFSVEKKKKSLIWSYDNIISSVKHCQIANQFFFFLTYIVHLVKLH